MKIIRENVEVRIADLKPYDKNARTHSPEQIKQIAASIKEFGFTNPVIVSREKGELLLIAGHGRIIAASLLGMTDVPAVVLTGLTEAQRRALVLSDNKLALNAGWDEALLAAELLSLQDVPDLLALTGFSDKEIDGLLGGAVGLTDEDAVPEPPPTPISVLGDMWLLGGHRVLCGDSTSPEDVALLMGGDKADMVFTDPPYGVSIGDKNKMLNSVQKAGRCVENIKSDTLKPDDLKIILLAAFKNAREVMNNCCAVYVCSPQGGGLGMMMMMMMMEAGLEIRHVLNWIKNQPTFSLGRLDYDYQHEPILFTWKKSHKKIMAGEHRTSCWFIDKPRESKLHPTMKPVAIPENAILNSSDSGDLVLDIFGGAGSTLIAAEKTGRRCRMMELDPKYVDVIVKRWQEFTGKEATHAVTGEKFSG